MAAHPNRFHIRINSRLPDQPVQNYTLFKSAYNEFIELKVQPLEHFVSRALIALRGLRRWEISAHLDDGTCVGGLVLAHDLDDPHVGQCVSVFAQYVLPEYRHLGLSRRFMREGIRIAREADVPVFAWTHRTGNWKYTTNYRRLHEEGKD